jgi:sugar diacid utilization regulator
MVGNEPVLNAVLATTQVMISELDPDVILQVLVEKISTLDGVKASAVFEYDEESYSLRVRSSAGLTKAYTRSISVPPVGSSGGAVGRAFQSRDPVLVGDIDEDPSFMPDVRRRLQRQDLQAVLAVPLIAREKLLGILTLYFPQHISSADYDMDTIRTLANLAALALDNARLYQSKVRASQEMESLYSQLTERSELLSRAVQIHNWLVRTVLTSDGLEKTTNALAELANGKAVVEDSYLNLLCVSSLHHSSTENGEHAGDVGLARFVQDPRVSSQVQHIGSAGRPELVPSIPEIGLTTDRIMAPVFVSDALLGFVSILASDRPFDKLDYILCEQGAVAVALEMMKGKVAYEVEQKIRGDLLESLLAGQVENLDRAGATIAGFRYDLQALQRVLIVRLDKRDELSQPGGAGDPTSLLRSLVYPIVERMLAESYPKSVLVGKGDSLVVLLGCDRPAGDHVVAELADRAVSTLNSRLAPATVSIGIGRQCMDPKGLRASFQEAMKGLEVADVLKRRGAVVSHADLGVYGILVRQSDPSELLGFALRYLEPLMDYDRAHEGGLMHTLAAYISNSYRLNDTARELIVHPNTVKYRLQKIEELSGARLNDAEGLMNLQLALRIHQLTAA